MIPFHIKLTKVQAKFLKKQREETGLSLSEIIRRAVDYYIIYKEGRGKNCAEL